ncbi:hypothetical protein BBR47_42400 [Brevibacillus brevis NBRC 100599]|uniref:Uncharacterized protein n=1 Tax=Brevibacillus brevis (strain 47 / JCM 6285 / NBRC 100599) TaxID=358681 RepID=C0ZHU3_BREBN|nr:hypothetical protein BBR47_42400 [Brevibacillus brevis NBRC 100599]
MGTVRSAAICGEMQKWKPLRRLGTLHFFCPQITAKLGWTSKVARTGNILL